MGTFKAELLTEIEVKDAGRFVSNPLFGAQEKHNGERRLIMKNGQDIQSFNREGDSSKRLTPQVLAVLRNIPLPQFVIDIELIDNKRIVILDALIIGSELLGTEAYKVRERRAHETFDIIKTVEVVKTARTTDAKQALLLQLGAEKAEGIVFRNMDAIYKQGRAGQHFKLKFWKDLDAVVMGPSPEGHNSVRVGVYNERGILQEICGVSLNGKPTAVVGNVICMKYLYATRERHAVQPELLFIRTDKRAAECTMGQLVVNKNFRR